jgi:hypothetical protein
MAKALTLRQVADIFTRQAAAYDKQAKLLRVSARDLPQSNLASEAELRAAIAAYDATMKAYYSADSATEQAATYTAMADAAGEPA